jgi:predicted transport protein
MLNHPDGFARDISKLGHHGTGVYEIKLTDSKDIGYVLSFVRQ